MKRIVRLGLLLVFSFGSISFAQVEAKKLLNRKVLLVIVDGIPADVLERVSSPNIDQISAQGAYSRAYLGGERGGYSETPTISAVGYNSLLTGTWANKHNVWGNDITAPNYNYWTIFRFLKEQFPEKRTAVFSTWEDNRTKLLGEGLKETGYLKLDYVEDGFELDTLEFPHDSKSKYIHEIDEEVVRRASASLKKDGPDLSWVYLQYSDDMGHQHGDGPELDRAVTLMDRQIGELYNAVQYRQLVKKEDWLIVITTDHGRDVATGKNHGGQTDREKTIWISTNAKDLNAHFYAHTPAIVDVLPSVANYLGITIPVHQARELDGVPFIGGVSVSHPLASLEKDSLLVQWTPHEREGKVKIWLAKSNRFKSDGQEDDYVLVKAVPITDRKLRIPITPKQDSFYKVVIQGAKNEINRWVFVQK